MLKQALQCLGLAGLLLLENYVDLLAGASTARLHVPFPLTNICIANILDILAVGLAAFILLALLRRTRFWPIARLALAILIPLYFLGREQQLLPFSLPDAAATAVYILWPLLLLVLFLRFRRWYRRAVQLAGFLGIVAGIFVCGSIAQLLWLTRWRPGPQKHTVAWATTPQPPRVHKRTVWIVFDELSYDQVFAHRAKDLPLPNFDRLRAASTLETNVQPMGDRTAKIIPALIGPPVGPPGDEKPVDELRFTMANQLSLHYEGVRGWRPVQASESIFADAQRLGWRTSAVGWYNPYCALYAGAIDDCYWTNQDRFEGPMAQNESILHNAATAIRQLERRAVSPAKAAHDICNYDVRKRLQTHLELEQHALTTLKNDQADFIFLHLSVPHSPNIWSRIDDNYTQYCDSSYLDNLALADRELGKFLEILEASPRWPDTLLLVQGDHSWRVHLWEDLAAWTDEDDQASRGEFDPRPVVLVHHPGQSAPATEASPWSLLNVHRVLEQSLRTP
jgi:hypothetical protein